MKRAGRSGGGMKRAGRSGGGGGNEESGEKVGGE